MANEQIPSEENLFSETDEINLVDEGVVDKDIPDTVEHRMNVHSFVGELSELPVTTNSNEVFNPSELEAELPFIEMDVEIPQVENEVEIPSIEVGEEIPTDEADDEIPTDEADDEINSVQSYEEISTTQTEAEILPFEMDDEIPTVEIHEEIPFVEMEEEIPTVEMEEEIPSVDMETEIPIDEMDIDIPVVEPDREIITEMIVNKVLAAEPELLRWETIIDSKQKEKFVKKMFDGNEAAYHKLLGELDDCHSWAKADAAIVRYLIRARKKHTDSIVIEFGNTIQKRFLENQ
ncbi:MAG: hypothetical protein IPM69_09210 [Ignavibacteria bacterium]|nr:hypothetical protein [Ignavibacteria bacterium]